MEEGTEQLLSSGAGGSVSVSLHPLVVMNVSDHFTRVKVQNDVPSSSVSGSLSLPLFTPSYFFYLLELYMIL